MGLKKITTEKFKDKFTSHYGNGYCLNNTVYINSDTKLTIMCEQHGVFEITPYKLFKNNI